MRTFVIGDIHGGLLALEQILQKAAVTTNDKLIFLGDYVDGWSHSPQVIDKLIELQSQQECICIRGNHDELILHWLKGGKADEQWRHHGGEATVIAYEKLDNTHKQIHIRFLESLEDYHLDAKNRLFVHAGFTHMNGIDFEYFPKMFYWDRTLWETALALNSEIKITDKSYPKRLTLYPEIYIGHTPVSRINETVPVNRACVWNLDTAAAFKGPLTIMNVDTKEFWQSEPLNELYPNEKGRN